MHIIVFVMKNTDKTKETYARAYGWSCDVAVIPKGSKVVPATNLPEGSFWLAEVPKGLKENHIFQSWNEHYGMRFRTDEVVQG